MKIIKELDKYINEELCDAEKYANLALMVAADYPEIAELAYYLSDEELKHKQLIHDAVVKLIAQKSDNTDPRTEAMRMYHNDLHEEAIEKEKAVRILRTMFRQ